MTRNEKRARVKDGHASEKKRGSVEGRSEGRGAKIDVGGEKKEFSKRGLMEAGGVGECESGKIFEIGRLRREKRGEEGARVEGRKNEKFEGRAEG